MMPVGRFGDDLDKVRRNAGFFGQFAQRGGLRVLAGVDAALGHLPRLDLAIEALADKGHPGGVEQHDADAGAIGQARGVVALAHAVASAIISFSTARLPSRSAWALGSAPRRVIEP